MHLLAAKPGGFVDDEGIIDLAQTPADIVILAAADSLLYALGQALHAQPESAPSVRLANWMQLAKPAAYDLYEANVLQQTDATRPQVVMLSLLGGEHYWPYGFERLQAWVHAKPNRHLIVVPGDDSPDPVLLEAATEAPEVVNRVWRYLREGGVRNGEQLFKFAHHHWFSGANNWLEPVALPNAFMVLSEQAISLEQWRAHYHEVLAAQLPVALVLYYRSHFQSGNTAVFSEFSEVLLEQGVVPLEVAVSSLKDDVSVELVSYLAQQTASCLILNATGFSANRAGSPGLASEPTFFASTFANTLPVLQVILSGSTQEDWLQQSQGLRSRDVAMQVVLPEMDGRIITRAISFKSLAEYHQHAQIDLIHYQLHRERATFVAQLANRYASLSQKPNRDKRIAFILANYPTKDGRIGNGVGLDTPASTVNLLQALAQAGYPIDNIPEHGNALIEALLGAVTNNPNTLHERGCWQSLALDDYLHYFYQLPLTVQQSVWERWGAPEDDHKCRAYQGQWRMMLAGIRLGETFIGIQPARGFNLDLVANYHDPDLIPPHSYLAYYFWLRHVYQVDAIVHVGKHGNLEWLPGKGIALSNTCWPDIAMGPVPHFYPFIVNDPGEGAQAKRRSHAAIIDHLMPPMTRAESYGDMAELEALVDEYYQAMGMDVRREEWLKNTILDKVQSSHLLEELGAVEASDEAAVLEGLDTYLCDIKESQIRHGLHRLGELPELAKLADTCVALLRLPRGSEPAHMGILHALTDDLGLVDDNFDPLASCTALWQGPKPDLLQHCVQGSWRTHADTKERLEVLAQQYIVQHVLNDQPIDNARWPLTSQLLVHAKQVLLAALKQSANDEIQALLNGLEGRFIPPGPSGAPTRGRLDTLPTGRNFFAVDNRAIPSPAAWAIGEKSAEALVMRHLQEHGDYPTNLGLSVWGTATMRTGGDDIAQAFALMGVRPIWAPGSNRVTDFEVLSCMQLGRPRVDVTLRVSGFFRDAFANVMRLYDAAVRAVAEFEEPGQGNTIRTNILEREQQLIAEGQSLEDAKRQARYRVFGSKPGAYGAGLQGLIDERCWDTQQDLAEAYLNWGGYAYGANGGEGIAAQQAFAERLANLEAVVQNQDNREHDLLDSDDYYQFQGGMTNAVTQLRGHAPQVYHSDHSNPAMPKIRTLKEELNRVIRGRVLNPKWIEAMREHGYKGAFEMTATVDYLFAYDATTDLIADYQYQQVTDTLLLDHENQAFMADNNPDAQLEMAERLLEAIQRGMWQSPGEYETQIKSLIQALDQRQETAHP